jgi:hypothetical protein
MLLSTCLAYVPEVAFGEALGPSTSLILSIVVGLVSYFAILWFLRDLRGE